ncbi:Detected protein of unknown function [Hibiscus syriacus]|uniref:DUF4408 domain-containing protein n=1 Tax=Hibiscus syriacus TaxID=106335 RepID=A0A6A3AN24_HIBSY|nr:Detected protein of unknown function [Hibiscus syriacus]
MNKLKKSQILILSVVAALLLIAPLLSSSSRPTYLYFFLNFIILSLGAEAGLGSVFTRSSYATAKPVTTTQEAKRIVESKDDPKQVSPTAGSEKKGKKIVDKYVSEKKINVGSIKAERVSLFFIGNGETQPEGVNRQDLEEEEEDVGVLSGPELFAKSETFIVNFYQQLNMQRGESWNKSQGFHRKAF